MTDCEGQWHVLTLPRPDRVASIMRCKCGAAIWLPPLPHEGAGFELKSIAVSMERARQIQKELEGYIWQ
jgi:hypothetical protein